VADDLELEAEDHRAQMRTDAVTPIAAETADFADTSINLAELDVAPDALSGFDAPITEPLSLDSHTEPQAADEADAPPADHEQVKVIGNLRIGIPLFNIFLNEADEQSRRLGIELAEWAHDLSQPVTDAAIALSHSLAGNSATVGFADLSYLARLLEHLYDAVGCEEVPSGFAQRSDRWVPPLSSGVSRCATSVLMRRRWVLSPPMSTLFERSSAMTRDGEAPPSAADCCAKKVFTKPGTYSYTCEMHPFMSGKIVVD